MPGLPAAEFRPVLAPIFVAVRGLRGETLIVHPALETSSAAQVVSGSERRTDVRETTAVVCVIRA